MSNPVVTTSRFGSRNRGKHILSFAAICLFAVVESGETNANQDSRVRKESGSISGRVTIKGNPAPGLALVLMKDAPLPKPVSETTTDERGRYQFATVSDDYYWIKVNAPEYLNLEEPNYWNGTGRSVSVAHGAIVTGADVDLILGGSVSGRITDVDGKPVADESVQLFAVLNDVRSSRPSWISFKTDENGEYRILGIPAGQYLVGLGEDIARLTGEVWDRYDPFEATGRVHFMETADRVGRSCYYEQTFYPGTLIKEEAYPIEISLEAEVTGVDITVGRSKRSFTARGRVVDAATGKTLLGKRRLFVSYKRRNGGGMGFDGDQVNDDGSVEIAGLLSGRFTASVVFKGDSDWYSDKVEFEITDSDVNGLEIKAHHGFTISGVVVIEGQVPADALAKRAQLGLIASSLNTGAYVYLRREVGVNADGTFKLIGMPRGPIELSATFCDVCGFFTLVRVEYPSSNRKGDLQVAEAGSSSAYPLINITGNMSGVRVVMRYKSGSIRSHVNVLGALPLGVRLMVNTNWTDPDGKRSYSGGAKVDANGDVLEEGLEPGTYELSVSDGSRNFTEPMKVTVTKNQQTKVSFTVDATKIERRY